MRSLSIYLCLLWLLTASCAGDGGKTLPPYLQAADTLVQTLPDSAYRLLKAHPLEEEADACLRATHTLLATWAAYRTYRRDYDTLLLRQSADYFQRTELHHRRALAHYLTAMVGEEQHTLSSVERNRQLYLGCREMMLTEKAPFLAAQLYHRYGLSLTSCDRLDEAIDWQLRYKVQASRAGSHKDEVIALINLSNSYLIRDRSHKEFATATGYALRAVSLAEQYGLPVELGKALGQLSTCYSHSQNFVAALQAATRAKDLDEWMLRLGKRKTRISYNRMADAHRKLAHADSAIYYARRGLESPELDMRINSHQLLYLTYCDLLGDSVRALSHLMAFRTLTDSLTQQRKQLTMPRQEAEAQLAEATDRGRQATRRGNRLLWGAILLTLGLTTLFGLLRYGYLRRLRHSERVIHRKEQQLHRRDRQLSDSSVRLRQGEEQRLQLTHRLVEEHPLVSRLRQQPRFLQPSDWEELRQAVDNAYNGFAGRLSARFPKLTELDLQLCLLMKLRFSVTQMSQLVATSPTSVSRQKQRLKHRLLQEEPALLDGGLSLDSFLQEF